MERRMNRYAPALGVAALIWRLALTTATGSIFGFLVAREAYDAAVMAPLFIAMSLSFGLATFILLLIKICWWERRALGAALIDRLGRLLGLLVAVALYFTAVQHLTNLYAAEHWGVERFLLLDGGVITALFWLGQVVLGSLAPLVLVFARRVGPALPRVALAAVLVILGGFAQVYVIVIGAQAYPLNLFPGWRVESSFHDGAIATYSPSLPEIGLGLGGLALAGAIVLVGLKVLRFLPASLADDTPEG
jgi:molybdopterin-containing oxidoreductase family membrane subunit